MFDKLLTLPLFQGISKKSLSLLVEKYPFHFLKFQKGDTIIEKGDACTHMRFVVSGSVDIVIESSKTRVQLSQTLDAPEVIAPDYLFGRATEYPCNVIANEDCGVLQIQKTDYIEMLQSEKILLFNILNYLSRNSQNRIWSFTTNAGGNFNTRFALLVYELTTRNSKNIKITYKQKDLCMLLGVRRTTLVIALEELKLHNIINYTQNEIQILNRRSLVDLIHA